MKEELNQEQRLKERKSLKKKRFCPKVKTS